MGVLSGIIGGLVAGYMYNKYHKISLPEWLGFFGGRRFVPIITAVACLALAAIFGYVWPIVQSGIDTTGKWMIASGAVGLFSYGTLNRLLIPTGLHHIINSFAWFVFGEFNGATGDLNRFFAGDPNAGLFMTGFFPVMMFGLPAAALAMYTAARKENKKKVAGILFSVGFTSFLTGVTEPIEFMFMFLAPVLYLIHAVLTGASMALVDFLGIKHGFGFSGGAIDYFLNMGIASKGWMIIPVGLGFAVLYYFLFLFFIKKFNLQTPGRETAEDYSYLNKVIEEESVELAEKYLEILGGENNIKSIDSCITRLRLEVEDPTIVDEEQLKSLGAKGVIKPGKNSVQVILGAKAEIIAQDLRKILKK